MRYHVWLPDKDNVSYKRATLNGLHSRLAFLAEETVYPTAVVKVRDGKTVISVHNITFERDFNGWSWTAEPTIPGTSAKKGNFRG